MKVLHLIQRRQLRGAEIFAAQLARHTRDMGHEAILVSLFGGEEKLPFDGPVISLGASKRRRFLDFGAWRRLAHIIREVRPQVIQANAGDTLKYAVFSKLLFRWRQPIVFRNASTISMYVRSFLSKWLNRAFFHFADCIVSVSNTSACDLMMLYPRLRHRVKVIPIGIEEAGEGDEEGVEVLTGQEGPALIHVGGFTFEKNHIRLFSIFRRVLENYPLADLHLVGDGPLRKNMEELVRQQGLQARVRFHGARPGAARYIRDADVLLLPSIIEGLPGAILEAFYCRTPVVAYDAGGICEVVKDRLTGRLIGQGDEEAFARAVVSTLRDHDARHRMTDSAYGLVTGGYLNKDIAARFLALYQTITHS